MENMAKAPYYLYKARDGYRMGDGKIVDGMVYDGLWEVYNDFHMGITGERIAEHYDLTREEVDAFAVRSHRLAAAAGIESDTGESWSELFHRVIAGVIEGKISGFPSLVLFDYPIAIEALARAVGGQRERWELYLNGREVANCYTEEVDPRRVAQFIEDGERRMKELDRSETIDTELPRLYTKSTEVVAGVALGVDRLLMDLLDLDSIEEATYFAGELF